MDRQPALTAELAAAEDSIRADQAVFTSVASPMGRGYRLVAASAGLSADEKRDITRAAPSHGNMLDDDADAVGCASFELSTGRRCVLSAWNAEEEHSGRGGSRVHTHAVVLSREDFARIHCDAVLVDAAVRAVVNPGDVPPADTRLEPFSFRPQRVRVPALSPLELTGATGERVLALVRTLLSAQRVLLVSGQHDLTVPREVISLLPPALARPLTLSVGLRFSPARAYDLVCGDLRPEEAERIAAEHDYAVFQWSAASPQIASETGPNVSQESEAADGLDAWFSFVRREWNAGQFDSPRQLCRRLGEQGGAEALSRLGRLAADLERIAAADLRQIEEILAPHLPFRRWSEAQMVLHLRLIQAAAVRRAALAPSPADPPADGGRLVHPTAPPPTGSYSPPELRF